MMRETHLFILWENALRQKEQEILEDMQAKF